MEAHDVSEERQSDGLCTVRVSQRYKVTIFVETVDHSHYHRFVAHVRQCFNKIQTNVSPNCLWHGQGQQETRRVQVLRLIALAGGTGVDEVLGVR
jgi:hypothetical protein